MKTEIDENLIYSVHEEVAIEDFAEVSLLFLAEQLHLIKINKTARKIIDLMDGSTKIHQIIKKISTEFNMDEENIRPEILALILNMISENVIYPEVKLLKNGRKLMSKAPKFMANPDVSLRIEDDDGAILFNPDSDSTQIINPIGLEIWKFLERQPNTLAKVVSYIKDIYDDAPKDEVEKDVEDFIMNLHSKGFIGEIVDDETG
jgi:hypothetical protein